MRALRFHELSGPDGLHVDELPTPVPGRGEVRVRTRAAGLNFPDVLLGRGKYQFKPEPPFIPGGELAGVVDAVGPGVSSLAVGDRVAATMIHGAFAEEVVVPELAAVKLPDRVPFETGAATLLTYATTYHALVDRARMRPGETLLVLGASGGVGTAAIDLGKKLGARVIAAASSEEKLACCRDRGADATIDYTKESLRDRAKALTDGRGPDVVYDAVGGEHSEPALRSIAWKGRFLVVGFAAGTIPKIPLNLVLLKGCEIVGVFWGQFAALEPEANRENASKILSWVADGSLLPFVSEALPYERARELLSRMEERRLMGKAVLSFGEDRSTGRG